jgi:hypothetical protein
MEERVEMNQLQDKADAAIHKDWQYLPRRHGDTYGTKQTPNWITGYIWGIADDVLHDLDVRDKYWDIILPMTILRRLDALTTSW